MFKGVVLAVALQLAQAPASDGLIHITCTIPADYNGGLSLPAIVDQIIVDPAKKVAWVNRVCGEPYVWPAVITEGSILIQVTCKQNDGSTSWQTLTIDRFTGSYTSAMQGQVMTLSGQCVAGQKQLFWVIDLDNTAETPARATVEPLAWAAAPSPPSPGDSGYRPGALTSAGSRDAEEASSEDSLGQQTVDEPTSGTCCGARPSGSSSKNAPTRRIRLIGQSQPETRLEIYDNGYTGTRKATPEVALTEPDTLAWQ